MWEELKCWSWLAETEATLTIWQTVTSNVIILEDECKVSNCGGSAKFASQKTVARAHESMKDGKYTQRQTVRQSFTPRNNNSWRSEHWPTAGCRREYCIDLKTACLFSVWADRCPHSGCWLSYNFSWKKKTSLHFRKYYTENSQMHLMQINWKEKPMCLLQAYWLLFPGVIEIGGFFKLVQKHFVIIFTMYDVS